MRFLFDENLSESIAARLAQHFRGSEHVRRALQAGASDSVVWGNRGQAHFDQRPMGSQVRDSGSLITRNVPIHDRASSESFLTYGAVLAPMLEAGYRMERFPSHMQVR